MTSIIKLEDMTAADFKRLAAALWEGGLVCLPADTVYGLASLTQPEATERIYEAKGREKRKPLALVFTETRQIISMVPDLPEVIAAALSKLMPGPVTCILPLASPLSSVGVRIIPPPAGDIYRHLPSPLAVTSANLSGLPDACTVDEIPEEIATACDFIIDGGRSRLCTPSTIVDLRPLADGKQPHILREGSMKAGEILRRLRTSILFVCTGNICRSPLAEAQLRDYAEKQGVAGRLDISSAGTHAWDGNPATHEAREAAHLNNLDLSSHRAREVRRSIMNDSGYVIAMTQRHHQWLLKEFPEHENKIYLALLFPRGLKGESPEVTDVPDPIGESVEFYLKVLEMLRPSLPEILGAALKEDAS